MAKIISEVGGQAARQTMRSFRRMFVASALAIGLMALIIGFSLCLFLQAHLIPLRMVAAEIAFSGLAAYGLNRLIMRNIDKHENEKLKHRKDALGEAAMGYILEALPDGYVVFNELRTLSGNVDHVVIGPTGIFVIDTKNWRGTITPDGQGELLRNGRSTGRGEVKFLLALISSLREKINILTHRDDFLQAILAFPLARVEVPWGTTRNVHCLADERIPDYIRKYRFSQPLKKNEIELIEQAFHALAGMKTGFDLSEGALTVLPVSK